MRLSKTILHVFSTALFAALIVWSPCGPDGTALSDIKGKGRFSGNWSGSDSSDGMHETSAGTIEFTINAVKKTFSCTMSGGTRGSGRTTRGDSVIEMEGSGSVESTACSGTYDPASGNISGTLTVQGHVTAYVTITQGEEVQTDTVSDSPVKTSRISGTFTESSGSGSIVDEDSSPASWSVTGSFSDATLDEVMGEDPCKDDPTSEACFDYMDKVAGLDTGDEDEDEEDEDYEDSEWDEGDPCFDDPDSLECDDFLAEEYADLMMEDFCKDDVDDECLDFLLELDKTGSVLADDKLAALLFSEEKGKIPVKQAQAIGRELAVKAFEEKVENPTKQDVWRHDFGASLKYVRDPEVKSAIAREFIKYKNEHATDDIESLQEKLDDIKEKHEFMDELDAKANKLKADLGDKLDENIAAAIDAYVKNTWKWAQDASPRAIKESMWRLEDTVFDGYSAEDAYKAGKTIGEFKEKAQDIYQVAQDIQKINERVAKGRITEGQAKVLRGGTVMAISLKYAAKGVPIFGEHMSEIIDGTMNVTLKFAGKRAERTTAIDNCGGDAILTEECMKLIEKGIMSPY